MDVIGNRAEKYELYSKCTDLISTSRTDLTKAVLGELRVIIETDEYYQNILIDSIDFGNRVVSIYCLSGDIESLDDNHAFHLFNEVATRLFGENLKGFILTSLFNCKAYTQMEMEINNGPFKYWTLVYGSDNFAKFTLEFNVEKFEKMFNKYYKEVTANEVEPKRGKFLLQECVEILYNLRLANIKHLYCVGGFGNYLVAIEDHFRTDFANTTNSAELIGKMETVMKFYRS
mgnify:CR=1 FL=1